MKYIKNTIFVLADVAKLLRGQAATFIFRGNIRANAAE